MKSQTFSIVFIIVLFCISAITFISCNGSSTTTTKAPTKSQTTEPGGIPDLLIEKITVEPGLDVSVGTVIKFRLTIKNAGTGNVNPSFYILLGNNAGFSGGLQAGHTKEVTIDWLAGTPGTFDIVWMVDYGKRIEESNEDNNTSEKFTINVN